MQDMLSCVNHLKYIDRGRRGFINKERMNFKDEVVSSFLEALKSKKWFSWKKGWMCGNFNGLSMREYQGLNNFWLSFVASKYGFDDP